ncbi:MAG: pyruvate formate-lyase, partial [Clostridia bacterium]|nr:pyruvate formate-lyase [Clostridia bacterium]
IPGCAMDVVNYGSMNLSLAVREAIVADLEKAADFESLMSSVRDNIEKRCNAMVEARKKPLWQMPSPVLEMLFSEIKYRNFGFHGAGIASAADQLAAVKKYVFDEKTVAPARLLEAIESNFENDPELLHLLRYEAPKMGNDEDEADSMACRVLEFYADALRDKRNIFGGRFRAGTGTALMYINDARLTPATADGRRDGESFGANYAPNLFSRISGPVSLVRSFSKPDLAKTINGGPFTVEFSADMFKNDEARSKTAKLVKHFIDRGGHQIQLNAVSLEDMLDAQVNPEAHRSLIVRVWGWSGYFVELDRCYQDHVIARRRYTV